MSNKAKGRSAWNKNKPMKEESKIKSSNTLKSKNRHWYTNGKENICCTICPEGYRKGRIMQNKKS